jgi:hypothetical protein
MTSDWFDGFHHFGQQVPSSKSGSQLSGNYDKILKATLDSPGIQLKIIGEDMPTHGHQCSHGTGLRETPPATRVTR